MFFAADWAAKEPQKSVCLDDNCMWSGVGCGRGLFGYFD